MPPEKNTRWLKQNAPAAMMTREPAPRRRRSVYRVQPSAPHPSGSEAVHHPINAVELSGIQQPELADNPRPSRTRDGRRVLAVGAGIAYIDCMRYTVRSMPAIVDHAIRERARAAGKSLNEAVVDASAEGAGVAGNPRKRRDLGDIAGTWKADKALESALAAQDRVDEDLWR